MYAIFVQVRSYPEDSARNAGPLWVHRRAGLSVDVLQSAALVILKVQEFDVSLCEDILASDLAEKRRGHRNYL